MAFGSSVGINACLISFNVDDMPRISDVFGDVALLQLLCHLLFGDAKGISLALPNGQPRLPGMRYVLHLLASCQRLMMPHRSLSRQWRAQFQLDDQYEARYALMNRMSCVTYHVNRVFYVYAHTFSYLYA